MDAVTPCIEKGCYQTRFSCDDAYIPLKVQPVTGLTERLCCIKSAKNETAHRVLNKLVADIANITRELMGMRLDFAVHAHNRRIDQLMGRLDQHSVLFSWMDEVMNRLIGTFFGNLPFPLLASPLGRPLPQLVPVPLPP